MTRMFLLKEFGYCLSTQSSCFCFRDDRCVDSGVNDIYLGKKSRKSKEEE